MNRDPRVRKVKANMKKIGMGIALWIATITGLHFMMNVNWNTSLNDRLPQGKRKLNVAYIPVT